MTVNPWRLTPRHTQILDELSVIGCGKTVAKKLGISHRTVEVHVVEVLARMGVKHRLLAVVQWDRWARAQRAASANDLLLAKLADRGEERKAA